ncbi:hypothetical protein EMCRGX_G027890 [Ephydatia muelleri]|eukprot:Em0020g736a
MDRFGRRKAGVEAFPVPKTKKDVRAFLGLTGYYRKFIPNVRTSSVPLYFRLMHQIGLSQVDDADNEHPVAYFSTTLLPRERRYSTIEKECLAIKLATHAFRDTS